MTEAQIQALGGGPSRFTIQAGQSYISMARWDAGPFIQDDWRVRPNLTLSLGLRYEVQTLVSDHRDLAPRLGFAWAPGSASERPAEDRDSRRLRACSTTASAWASSRTAALNNGVNQLQYTVYNPTFYPNIPSLSTLSAGQNSIYTDRPEAARRLQHAGGHRRGAAVAAQHHRGASPTPTTASEHLAQTVPDQYAAARARSIRRCR